jgi:hypothetical protein
VRGEEEVTAQTTSVIRRRAVVTYFRFRTMARRHPALAFPVARWLREGEVIDANTEIVIEGFPSSANSFAVAAFRTAQEPKSVQIAHHTHAPAQVIKGLELRIPTMVLIREPEEAVLSLLARSRSLTPDAGLRGYIGFYEPLVADRGRFVVGSFTEVTTDFGAVINRVNALYGTSFRGFAHTEENAARMMDAIEAWERTKGRSIEEMERLIPLPSEVRSRRKDELREPYREASDRLRGRANELFGVMTSDPSPQV